LRRAKPKKASSKKAPLPKHHASTRPAPIRLLLTGFGPFPGAPVNPTGPLIRALKRKLQSRAGRQVDTHVFRTTYGAVDRELPRLLARKKPDTLLMFGLATRSRGLRVETQARNRICRSPDAAGVVPHRRKIAEGAPRSLPIRAPKAILLRAAKSGTLPARLSVNAGDYLCNYLYWHALESVGSSGGPSRAVFIHVPPLDAGKVPRSKRTMDNLVVAAAAIAEALIKPRR
jgi:pyroglutamyl-peptidase